MRQKIAAPGPTKLRTIFPHTSVLPKPPQSAYGKKQLLKRHKKGSDFGFLLFPETQNWGHLWKYKPPRGGYRRRDPSFFGNQNFTKKSVFEQYFMDFF